MELLGATKRAKPHLIEIILWLGVAAHIYRLNGLFLLEIDGFIIASDAVCPPHSVIITRIEELLMGRRSNEKL